MQALKLVTTKRPFQGLHDEVMAVSKDLKRHYLNLFELLLEVEERQIYQQFEIVSLYIYCVELRELSPANAHDFVTVLSR